MLNIPKVNSVNTNKISNDNKNAVSIPTNTSHTDVCENLKSPTSANLKAYHPSFSSVSLKKNKMLKQINQYTDKNTKAILAKLDKEGILDNNTSNDGSTVLENLYKIANEPRIEGLNPSIIISEVVKALNNPFSITQKFGDIPDELVQTIEEQTGEKVPEEAKHVFSASCVVTSMEFKLASQMPSEFVRFAEGLSSQNYSVNKNVKLSNIADGTMAGIWTLREFNKNNNVYNSWDDVNIKIQPDRNAIVRSRMQASYKDKNERSCVDVLIQSALLNLGSQLTYDSITDKRTGKFNPDDSGLTEFEKNIVEQIIFEVPIQSVIYQNIDENGKLAGYNAKPDEVKQHIINSLNQGKYVIIGYTHLDENNTVDGGHEITIVGYEKSKDGKGIFICNDTDDDVDEPILIEEEKLIPLIHHAGIPKEALNKNDIVVEPWREIVNQFQNMLKTEK